MGSVVVLDILGEEVATVGVDVGGWDGRVASF